MSGQALLLDHFQNHIAHLVSESVTVQKSKSLILR